MAFPFQVAEVVRPLRVDVRRAIATSYKLQRRVPKRASASARKCVEQLHARTEALALARRTRVAAPRATDNRGVVLALINAWSSMQGRLVELTKIDPAEMPEAAEAQTLLAALFPNGMAFLKAERGDLWVDSRSVLETIDQGGHAEPVARLAGEFVLKAVRKAHRICGTALGLTSAGESAAAESVDLKPLLDAVTESMAAYALQLIAGTDPDDAVAVREVAHALDPIVQHRKRTKAARAGSVDKGSVDASSTDSPAAPVAQAPQTVSADAPAANDGPVIAASSKARRVA